MYSKSSLLLLLLAVLVLSALSAAILVSQVTAESSEPADPLELYDSNDNGVIDAEEFIQATVDYFDGLIDGTLAFRVWLLFKSTVVTGQAWSPMCDRYDEDDSGVIERDEAIQATRDYFDDVINQSEVLAVYNCYYGGLHSIGISDLASSLEAGESDEFTVTVSGLIESNSYTLSITTNNSNIGFSNDCSDSNEEATFTGASDVTSKEFTFTIHACSSPGGTVEASLSMRTDSEEFADIVDNSQGVEVTSSETPTPPENTPVPAPTPVPTAVPTPLSFGTATIGDLRFQGGESVSTSLPVATGGTGALTYEVSPAMGNGLTFNPSTRTIVGSPAAAAETVIYTYTARDRNGNTGQLRFTITVFDVDLRVGTGELAQRQWLIWTTASATIALTIPRPDDYQFRVSIPASAGFQLNSRDCTWPAAAPTSTSTLHSRWFHQYGHFVLTRCGIGAGNTARIKVWVKLEEDETPSLLYATDVTIPHSWHAQDNRIDYYVMGTGSNPNASRVNGVEQGAAEGMFPAGRPSNLPSDYSPDDDLLKLLNHDEAAKAWTDVGSGVTMKRVSSDGNADVLVAGYWEPGKSSDICGGSIACYAYWGSYPHFGSQTRLWIEEPPRWRSDYGMNQNSMRQWTVKLKTYLDDPTKYAFLPAVLMHEFGHTIGLWHGGSNSVMVGQWGREDLSPDDREAANAIYRHHTAHADGGQ